MAQAGKSGTLKRFGINTELAGNYRAKSGSMYGVKSYTGYLKISGQLYATTIIINNFSVPDKQVRAHIESLLEKIVRDLK